MVKMKPEDLIKLEAMLDKRVQDAMAANTSGSIALMVEELRTKKIEIIYEKNRNYLKHML